MTGACYEYWGLRLACNEPWPALAPFLAGGPEAPAQVHIDTRPGPLACQETKVSITPERVQFQVAGVGRFVITGGTSIAIVPDPAAARAALELYLFGSAWGALCYQRGLLPLHASVVHWGGGASAFCGPSGAGKSTLVAWLVERGARLLSDDLCRCDPDTHPAPVVWPSLPRLKLWRQTLTALGRSAAGLTQDLLAEDKFIWPNALEPTAAPQPLRAIYLLEWGPLGLERLAGVQALRQFIAAATYRPVMLDQMGRMPTYWRACARLLRRVPVYRLRRPQAWSSLAAAASLLEVG